MSLDELVLAAVLAGALLGALQGARAHTAQLGAVLAGWLGTKLLAPALVPAVRGHVPAFAAGPAAAVLAFVLCAAGARVALGLVLALLVSRDRERGGLDRGMGALLGAGHFGLALWVLTTALVAWGRPVHLGPLDLDPARSDFAALVRGDGGRRGAAVDAAAPARRGR